MSASADEVACHTLRVRGLLGWSKPILITGGRAVADYREAFVGIDVAKLKKDIAIADAGCQPTPPVKRVGDASAGQFGA